MGTASGAVRASTRADSPPSGLIHWWKFNGSGTDSAGETNLVPIGPVKYVPAVMGQGIELNGVTTGLGMAASREMQFQGSFTISAWALLRARPSGKMWSSIIFDGDDRPGLDPYALQVRPNGLMVFLVTGKEHSGFVEWPFPLNRFVLVTAVYDKKHGTLNMYLDGKLKALNGGGRDLTPVVPLAQNANAGVGIGTNNQFQNSMYNFGWDGIINDLRVYNRALSRREIERLYDLGVSTAKQSGLDLTQHNDH